VVALSDIAPTPTVVTSGLVALLVVIVKSFAAVLNINAIAPSSS